MFDELDERLADGRPYLMGSEFTRADITLASLGAISVWQPSNYTGMCLRWHVWGLGGTSIVSRGLLSSRAVVLVVLQIGPRRHLTSRYLAGGRSANMPELDMMPDALRAEVIKLRARPTGKLIAKLYEQERLVSVPSSNKPV
jgi:hypothetical protein